MLFVYKVNMLLRGVGGEPIWQENRFRPEKRRLCCSASLLRTAGTTSRKSEICWHCQPHLDFTKPQKLGHLGACSLENDSPALYYLSEDFIPLVSSPSSSPLLSSLSSFCAILPLFPFYLPPSPSMCPWCCSGVDGWDGEKMKAGRQGAATERFHLLSAGLLHQGEDTASGCSDTAEQNILYSTDVFHAVLPILEGFTAKT